MNGPGTLTTAWVRKCARLTVLSGAATARLRFYHYINVGWVAVDDVEFIRVGQSQNLAPDPGFELGTGWSAVPTVGSPGTSLWRGGWGTGNSRSGTYAFVFSNHSYGMLRSDPIAVSPGATYTLSAWVRGELNAQASGGGWTLRLLAYDRHGAFISSYTVALAGAAR